MSETKLVIAFDARIGNLERQLERMSGKLRTTDAAATKTKSTFASMASAASAFGTKLDTVLGPLGRVAGVLGVGLGIGAAVSGFMSLADAVGNLGEQADQVGVSIEGLQAWTAIGAEFNVTAEGMSAALGRLTRTTGEAAEGNTEALASFTRLGVSIRDSEGNVRSTEEVLTDLARAISELPSAAEQAAAAVQFFGRAGQRLLPLLVSIGQGNRDVVTSMRDAGVVISGDVSAAYDKFGDNLSRFSLIVRNVIASALAPLANVLGDIIGRINGAIEATNRAARIRAGGATVGDDDALREVITEAQTAEARAQANYDNSVRNRRAPGQTEGFARALQTAQENTRRLQADLTRIEGEAEARRTQQAADGARARADAVGQITTQSAEQLAQSQARAAAVAQGPAALRQFEINQRAQERTTRAVEDARKRGATLTAEETAALQAQSLVIERNNAAQVASGGTSEAQRQLVSNIREATTALEGLGTSTRTPLETLDASFARTTEALATLTANTTRLSADQRAALASVGFEQFARQAEQGAERTAKAMRESGATTAQISDQISASVAAFGQALVAQGRITATELEQLQARSQAAAAKTAEATGTFQSGLRAGLGFKEGDKEIGFGETLGLGLGQEVKSTFDNLFSLFDEIAKGSKTAGEALLEFAADFAKSVLKIIAQAAALQAARAILSAIFPATPSGTSLPPGVSGPVRTSFGGFRMAGGPVSAGMSYIVGERGPEVFTPSGSGRITANGAGGGPQLVINNNAPGVVVTQQQVDERTVIAAVNLSRTEVTRDYQRSMRTGHGPYAEGLSGSFNVRRRL